jgi:hypothetical protein
MSMFANTYPDEALTDLRAAIEKYILPGFTPPAPILSRSSHVLTIGSCFAETIHHALERADINSRHLFLAETVNTPPSALLVVQRLRGKDLSAIGHLDKRKLIDENAITELRGYLPHASAFILTLGVALQPFHEDGLPTLQITRSTVGDYRKWVLSADSWHMLSVDEVVSYGRRIIEGLRALRPGAPVILTLSPVPLANSRHPSVMGEDCLSKSTLRVAIATLMEEEIPDVYYWPSFEVIRWLGSHVGSFFTQDNRHIDPGIIDLITELFIEKFFDAEASAQPLKTASTS